jgi:hypothetical protein
MAVERYLTPSSVEETLHVLHEMGDDAKVISGGQSLLLLMRDGFLAPRTLVGLRNVGELAGIAVNGSARIHARATHTEVLSHPQIRAGWPVVADAEEAVASVQVRNRGTLCGNLAHAFPNADPPAALLVVDAVAEVAGQEGRREVPMENFITGALTTDLAPDELLTSIALPPPPHISNTPPDPSICPFWASPCGWSSTRTACAGMRGSGSTLRRIARSGRISLRPGWSEPHWRTTPWPRRPTRRRPNRNRRRTSTGRSRTSEK